MENFIYSRRRNLCKKLLDSSDFRSQTYDLRHDMVVSNHRKQQLASTVISLKDSKEKMLFTIQNSAKWCNSSWKIAKNQHNSSIDLTCGLRDYNRLDPHETSKSHARRILQKSRYATATTKANTSFALLIVMVLILVQQWLQQLMLYEHGEQSYCCCFANSIAPTIDYSHNMRILKLPKTTQAGSLIYRLKGSDADPNTQLTFGVLGPEARSLLEILPIQNSWNEADVYLRTNLEQFIASQLQLQSQQQQNLQPQFNLTLYVSDGNMTTQIESTILITDPELEGAIVPSNSDSLQQQQQQSSAFINTKHIFHIPENLQLDEPFGQISVLESDSNELPVRFELRGKGSDKFNIKYVFGPRGQSRGQLHLAQNVDYEKQNLFNLKILALNAWTDSKWDTRNVVTMDIVITLSDVQDTAPIFKSAPSSLRVTNVMQIGDLIGIIEAEDGDLGDQRPIHFALDASSPLAEYFSIDKLSGQIRLVKTMQELGLHAAWDSPTWSVLTVIASEPPDPASYDRLWPPMYSKLELPLMLVDIVNEPPQFLGGWQTNTLRKFQKRNNNAINKTQILMTTNGHVKPGQQMSGAMRLAANQRNSIENNLEMASSSTVKFANNRVERTINDNNKLTTTAMQNNQQIAILHAFLSELSTRNLDPSGQLVRWYTNGSSPTTSTSTTNGDSSSSSSSSPFVRPIVIDLGLGQNGTFQVHLEGPDAVLFRLEPSMPVAKQSNLMLFVADSVAPSNWSLFDRDSPNGRDQFRLDLVARDFGQPHRLSNRIHCQIDLLELNDNAPQFESDLYSFSVYENAQRGQLVGQVRARDPDANSASNSKQLGLKYGPLTGANSNLFKIQADSGQILLEGPLDRERDPMYLLLVEVSDLAGNSNYTKIIIQILDYNDNSPQFLQPHYDAVLLSDGTFHQPLVVKAVDLDEPGTANSQVAYEIIAGNRDEQFVIDSLTGHIYPNGQQPSTTTGSDIDNRHQLLPPPLLPPAISSPIEPYNRSTASMPYGFSSSLGGKNLPGREIEETTANPHTPGRSRLINTEPSSLEQKLSQNDDFSSSSSSSLPLAKRMVSNGHPTATTNGFTSQTEAMLKSESTIEEDLQQHVRSLTSNFNNNRQSKLPPIITLVVRAHDFGIPLRSSTVRVNIYNQAQLSRTLSVILNGTAEQIDSRRDSIERAFSSLTGSRAIIESVESLSDSSSLCVAHFKLIVPQHNLVDLTDLSGLMDAIDYRPHSYTHPYSHAYPPQHEHSGSGSMSSQNGQPKQHTDLNNQFNSQFGSPAAAAPANITSMFPDLTHPFHLNGQQFDPNGVAIERRLLIYIIIVAICILSLLVLWMVYSCNNQNNNNNNNHQL